MSPERPQPDHTHDPRDRETGAGYPEEQPAGAQPGEPRDDEHGDDDDAPGASPGPDDAG